MTVVVQTGSFVTPVTFAITRLEPPALLPEIGSTSTGIDVMLDPIAGYEIAFDVPVLNRDATLTFDVYPASLDAATRDAFLAALAIGEATIATKSDAGSRYRTFPICGQLETPSAGGCVRTEMLDGNGEPTDSMPAIVRFSNVVGHFSTWAVVISAANDTTPPAVMPTISGTLGANGWYVGDVSFYWDVRDDESPVTTTTGCEGASVTSDIAGATFTCTATSAGGTASGSITIRRDATPPQSALPADITIEAAGPSGATATYAGSVIDNIDPSPLFACAPASGNVFPVGATVVNCTASDVAGNSSAGSFRVSVVDTTPPVLVVPGDLSVDAVNPAGAPVSYLPAARDVVDATPTVACQPASGSVFPIGATVVICTATDSSGNAATGTFSIRVRGAVEQIVSLIDKTRLYLDLPLLEAALKARLEEATAALLKKSTVAACRAVNLYISAVTRMPSSQLSAVERSELIADAHRVKAVIGCR